MRLSRLLQRAPGEGPAFVGDLLPIPRAFDGRSGLYRAGRVGMARSTPSRVQKLMLQKRAKSFADMQALGRMVADAAKFAEDSPNPPLKPDATRFEEADA
jgi:hypothetical protein